LLPTAPISALTETLPSVVPLKQALHVGAHFTQQLFQAFAVGSLYAQVGLYRLQDDVFVGRCG